MSTTVRDGDFVEAARGLEYLVAAKLTLDQAEQALVRALLNGDLRARGIPDETNNDGIVQRRSKEPLPREHIPPIFWSAASVEDQRSWDFQVGRASCSDRLISVKGGAHTYHSIEFKLDDLRAIEGFNGSSPPKGRRPSAAWPDWVGALVALVYEGKIGIESRPADVHKLVADRMMQNGHFDYPQTTYAPTAQRALEMLREAHRNLSS